MLYPAKYGNDPLFPQACDFRVMFKDNLAGKGVFTYRAFAQGEVIAKMAGEITESYCSIRCRSTRPSICLTATSLAISCMPVTLISR